MGYLPPKNPRREESKCQTCQNAYAHKCFFIAAILKNDIKKSLENKKYKVYKHKRTNREGYDTSIKILECPDYLEENKKNIKKAV